MIASLASRSLCLFVLVALALSPVMARGDFQLVTDPDALNPNDRASWSYVSPFERTVVDPMISQGGESISWTANLHSTRPQDDLIQLTAPNNDLEIGGINVAATVEPLSTATLDFRLDFSSTNLPIFGAGFEVTTSLQVGDSIAQFTATDVQGNSQTFDLPTGLLNTFYVGVLSDTPLASLEIFENYTGENGGVSIATAPLDLNVAPAPPGLVLAGLGAVGMLLVRGLRSYRRG